MGGFKRPEMACGTSGRSVNIDFRFLRIFVRLEALIKNIFPTVLYYGLEDVENVRYQYVRGDYEAMEEKMKGVNWDE